MSEQLKHLPREERFRIFVEQSVEEHMAKDPDFQARISGLKETYQKLLFMSGLRLIAVPSRKPTINEALKETKKEAALQGMSAGQIRGVVHFGGKAIAEAFKSREYGQQRETRRSHFGGGTSPFIWEEEANPKGLGYVQSKRGD